MKGISLIGDFIISIVIVICILAILSVFFYDKVSLSKVIPESEEYTLTKEMEQEIEDESLEEIKEVVTQYYIDASDLKKYEKTKEYNKGKKNPFAVEEVNSDNSITNSTSDNNLSNNESENFYEDDGTK